MGNIVGFIGDAAISTNPNPTSAFPRTMTMMSFTGAFDVYNHPEDIVIDYVYAYKNGTITPYTISSTNVTYTDTKFLIKVDDGTHYIVLNQNIATEFGIIPGVEIEGRRSLPSPRAGDFIGGFLLDNFSLAKYANQSAYVFIEGNETYGFSVMMNTNQTSYSLCNITNFDYSEELIKYTGQINGESFTADLGEYFPDFYGLAYLEQYDSMAGFKNWFAISSSRIWVIIILLIALLIIFLIVLAWGFGWFR